jgi:hypothetical protein
MTAGVRRSLHVKHRWRGTKRAPCLNGAGRKTDGGRQAIIALLHTICRQYSAERGPPHDGGREVLPPHDGGREACDTPLAKRGARALPAWGRASGGWRQVSYYSIAAHDPPAA